MNRKTLRLLALVSLASAFIAVNGAGSSAARADTSTNQPLIYTPNALDFGAVEFGTTAVRQVVITNPNSAAVDLDETASGGIIQGGVPYSTFDANLGACNHINAKSHCTLTFTYNPSGFSPNFPDSASWYAPWFLSGASQVNSFYFSLLGTPAIVPALDLDLSALFNVQACSLGVGNPVLNGGLDGLGNAYAGPEDFCRGGLFWQHQYFIVGAGEETEGLSGVWGASVPIDSGPGNPYPTYGVAILGAGILGAQLDQPFVLTYDDGSSETVYQSFSDWKTPQNFPGENVALTLPTRVKSDGITQQPGPYHLYGYVLPVKATRRLSGIKMPNNRRVVALAIQMVKNPLPRPVDFSAQYNVQAVRHDGKQGIIGLDGQGNTISYEQLSGSALLATTLFKIPPPNGPDAVSSVTIALPPCSCATVQLLAVAVNGTQSNQPFVVTYTDGTSSTILQTLNDWHYLSTQYAASETAGVYMAYRLNFDGTPHYPETPAHHASYSVREYSLGVDASKTLASLKLPDNRNVVVLAVSEGPTSTAQTVP